MLRDTYSVKAVEMEGAGIADVTWSSKAGYMVIRGICDYCDDAKNDVWHLYAAATAAAYTRALLEEMHSEEPAGPNTSDKAKEARYSDRAEVPCAVIVVDGPDSLSRDPLADRVNGTNTNLVRFVRANFRLPDVTIEWERSRGILVFPILNQDGYANAAHSAMLLYHSLDAFFVLPTGGNLLNHQPPVRFFYDIINLAYNKVADNFGTVTDIESRLVAFDETNNSYSRRLIFSSQAFGRLSQYSTTNTVPWEKLVDRFRADNSRPNSDLYLYPSLRLEKCCLTDLFNDNYTTYVKIDVDVDPASDCSDLWYVLIQTDQIENARRGITDAFKELRRTNAGVKSVIGWSLLGACELLIKYRAPEPLAQAVYAALTAGVPTPYDKKAKRSLIRINVGNEWVRDNSGEVPKFSLGRLDQRQSFGNNQYRNMKAFIRLDFGDDGMDKQTEKDLTKRLVNYIDIVETYAISHPEAGEHPRFMMIEAHLPCGHLFRLQELADEIEPWSYRVRSTYLTYTDLNFDSGFRTLPTVK